MNRTRWIALATIVAVLGLGGWWLKSRGHQDAPKYRTAALERGDITATVSATGSVQPVLQVLIGSQVSGTLSNLYVDFNSHVHAGEVLAQLETSAFKARLAQAEASVARAEASLKDGVRQLARAKELQKGDYVSQADVDAADVAVEQRKADLKQARASLESAQVDLSHATIRSPIDGVVISRSIDVGQTVAASLQAPQLFVIANDLKQMRVETKIDEADIGRIRVGLPVRFTVDAFPDVNFYGKVWQVRLQPITESNVVTYTTVISTSNDDLKLRPGMTANVTVQVETRSNVLKVPNAALRFKPQMAGGANGPGGMPGGPSGPSGVPGGGMRRSIAALADAFVPGAWAQDGPPPNGPGGGDRPGGNDPYLQMIRAKVQSGEITREQARGLMRKHFDEMGAPPVGGPGMAPPAGGAAGETRSGRPGAPRGAEPNARAKRAAGGSDGTGMDARGGKPAEGRGQGSWAGRTAPAGMGGAMAGGYKPGVLWVLRSGKPARVMVLTGLSDGATTEIQCDTLKEGDMVIVGLDQSKAAAGALQPPPGMGGSQFRGPGGGRR